MDQKRSEHAYDAGDNRLASVYEGSFKLAKLAETIALASAAVAAAMLAAAAYAVEFVDVQFVDVVAHVVLLLLLRGPSPHAQST
jgi:hypothetical protein